MAARKKKAGAPRGNSNALKHGFYSNVFNTKENKDLDVYLCDGLKDEIVMLRVVTRRVLALAEKTEDLDKAINLLGALGLAATRLAGLLRTQKPFGGEDNEVTKAIQSALTDVLKEWDRA